jgi:signal transduction histidine kinase/ligand-binding sensor domain-containing protein
VLISRFIPSRRILFGLAILLALVANRAAWAQQPVALSPNLTIGQHRLDSWGERDGLEQSSVIALTQTEDGFLWLATDEGLVRFDGVAFETFDKTRVPAFRVHDIVALVPRRAGGLWIGTRGGGLLRFDGRFTRFDEAHGATSAYITALYEDNQGTLWAGTYGGGLLALTDSSFTAYGGDAGFSGEFISSLSSDGEGGLWVGTEIGLLRFRKGRFDAAPETGAPTGLISAQVLTLDGTLWAATREGGLFTRKDGRWSDASARLSLGDTYANSILADHSGHVWLATTGGRLWRLAPAGSAESFTSEDAFGTDDLTALALDREGSLWIGSRFRGLHRIRQGKFTPLGHPEGLPSDRVYSVYESNDGAMWFGTDRGVARRHGVEVTRWGATEGLGSEEVLSVIGEQDGTLWFGTYGGGLHRWKNGRISRYTTRHGLPSDNIFALFIAADHSLWIATDAGAARFDGTSFTPLTRAEGLPSDFITAFGETADGSIWIGTYDAGLARYRAGRIESITSADGLTADAILALLGEGDALWIGTYGGGLNRWRADSLDAVTQREGLFNDNVYTLLDDAAGGLWMSCNKGIFRIDKKAFERVAAGDTTGVVSIAYDKTDGLRHAEGLGGQQPAGWRSRDGRLWFTTIAGAASIDPGRIPINSVPPAILVTGLLVDEHSHPLPPSERVTIPPGRQKFHFTYTATSLANPGRVLFRYRLDGFDSAWSEPTPRREAYYTNLPPGEYTLQVVARNDDGIWNRQPASLPIYLEPYFYQTSWFKLLSLVALVGLALAGYTLRVRQLQARQRMLEQTVEERTRDLRLEKEKTEEAKSVIEAQADKLRDLDRFKTRFFANLSHEFRTPLTMIIGPLENLISGAYGAVGDAAVRQGQIMLRNAQRLLRLINQLLDLSKLEAGKMELRSRERQFVPFLEGIVYSCLPLAETKKITLRFTSASERIPLHFEPDKLEKVFFNLLSNALKFTPAEGTIDVELDDEPGSRASMPEGAVRVVVRDTGKGIPEAELPYIFDRFHQVDGSNTREHEGTGIGLALVQELVLLHKGEIQVTSTWGAGTTFTVILPKGKKHLSPDQIATDEDLPDAMPARGALMELSIEGASLDHHDDRALVTDRSDKTILIVEDNPDVREYVSSILGTTYRVVEAVDGVEGLEKARSASPDLVVSDVMMPRMDGNEMCRRIKDDPELDHLPVLLLTARATNDLRIEGLEARADDFLAKPFNARELMTRVANLIALREQEKELKRLNADLEKEVAKQLEIILSERLKYEEELLEAKEEAERSSRLKSSILDNVNHEFRTPIAGIVGSSDLLALEVPAELRELVDIIKLSADRLMRTLNAVVELGALESETYRLHVQPTDVLDVLEEVLETQFMRVRAKGLDLQYVVHDESLPAEIDPVALRRVFELLLDNAVKFTEKGSVRVNVSSDEDTMRIQIADTGIGIDPSFLPHIFEAFVQESTGMTRDYEGCGIGLTIAHRLVMRMGGRIEVETHKGAGSTFSVVFPLRPHTAQARMDMVMN